MEDKDVISYTVEKHIWEDEKRSRNKKKITIILSVLIGIVLIIGAFTGGYFLGKTPAVSIRSTSDKQEYIKDILTNQWYFAKDHKNILSELDKKVLEGLTTFEEDKHTEYLTKDEYELMFTSLQGSFFGIGVSYAHIGDQHVIKKVIKNSPAEKAGMKINDIIIKVDGNSIVGLDSGEISKKVRGPKGSKVVIGFLRNGEEMSLEIIRDVVSTALEYSIVDNVGVLHLNSFTENGKVEVENAFKDFQAQGIDKVIIDLRDNGGGYLKTTLDIAGLILPKGTTILKQEDISGKSIENKTTTNPRYQFSNIVVLINENSASASEVLSAALREQAGIKLVGVNSFGKGTVQVTQPFKDGSALKYTVAQWFSPQGNQINKVGVKPDIEVKQHSAFSLVVPSIEENIKVDQVSTTVGYTQSLLNFLNDSSLRSDGYFDIATKNSIEAYQRSKNLSVTGEISKELITQLRLDCELKYNSNPFKYDNQLQKAIEVVNGN